MLLILALLILPTPPSADRAISHDVARLPLSRALELEGHPHRYRVALDSTAWEDDPTVAYDLQAPAGVLGTLRLPTLPIGHEYPDEFEAVLQVVRHPAREINPTFTQYRLVGRMVRPVPPVEGGEG